MSLRYEETIQHCILHVDDHKMILKIEVHLGPTEKIKKMHTYAFVDSSDGKNKEMHTFV